MIIVPLLERSWHAGRLRPKRTRAGGWSPFAARAGALRLIERTLRLVSASKGTGSRDALRATPEREEPSKLRISQDELLQASSPQDSFVAIRGMEQTARRGAADGQTCIQTIHAFHTSVKSYFGGSCDLHCMSVRLRPCTPHQPARSACSNSSNLPLVPFWMPNFRSTPPDHSFCTTPRVGLVRNTRMYRRPVNVV